MNMEQRLTNIFIYLLLKYFAETLEMLKTEHRSLRLHFTSLFIVQWLFLTVRFRINDRIINIFDCFLAHFIIAVGFVHEIFFYSVFSWYGRIKAILFERSFSLLKTRNCQPIGHLRCPSGILSRSRFLIIH